MGQGKFVSYLRVSTKRQGISGLGLEAQRKAVGEYLNGGDWQLVGEFQEVEHGDRDDNRPELHKALALCRIHHATLVIAKLDRLSRDAKFLLSLEADLQRMGLRFVAADMPDANELTIHIMAVVAQAERKMIGARTRAALARKREFYANLTDEQRKQLQAAGKATQLGGDRGGVLSAEIKAKGVQARKNKAHSRAVDMAPIIADIRVGGATTLQAIADALNARNIPAARGGCWSPVQVMRVENRLIRAEPG